MHDPGRRRVALVLLALFSFAVSLYVQREWFPHLSKNNDEAVYLLQGELLADGRLTLPAQNAPEAFRPWMSGPVDDRLIMVFPPAWPAALAAGIAVFDSTRVVVALVAASIGPLCYLLCRELLRDRRVALASAVLTAASPFVIVLSGTLLSYLFGFALDMALGSCALLAVNRRQPRYLALSGLAAGVLVGTRPLDAILFGVIFAVLLVVRWRGERHLLGSAIVWGVAGAAIPVALVLWYNAVVTGHPLRFPIEAAGGNNAFGFGDRYIAPGTPVTNVTPYKMVRATVQNLAWYPLWVLGGVIAVPLAVGGAIVLWRRARRAVPVLAAITVAFPLAYLFYWGTLLVAVGRREFGPHYYVPLLVPASVVVAMALDRVARRSRSAAVAIVALMVAVTSAVDLPAKYEFVADHNALVEPEVAAITTVPRPAVLIVPRSNDGAWILHPRGYLRNTPTVDGSLIVAGDAGAQNFDLFARFPDRPVHKLLVTIPTGGSAERPTASAPPLVRIEGAALSIEASFTNGVGGRVVTAYVGRPGSLVRCVVDDASEAGRQYRIRFEIDRSTVTAPSECRRMVGPASVPETDIGQLLIGFSTGESAEWFGVDRFEYLASFAATPSPRVLWPGDQRRVFPGALDDRPAVFIGQVDDVLAVAIAPDR